MLDIVFKYIHHMITEEELIAALEVQKLKTPEFTTDLDKIINYINDRIENYTGELFHDVINKIINSLFYKKLSEDLSVGDVYNLIMDCFPHYIPNLEQPQFDDLVSVAVDDKNPCEKLWCLIDLYVPTKLNLNKALDFILLSENAFFIGQTILSLEKDERLQDFAKKLLRMNNKKIFNELIKMDYLGHVINLEALKQKLNG